MAAEKYQQRILLEGAEGAGCSTLLYEMHGDKFISSYEDRWGKSYISTIRTTDSEGLCQTSLIVCNKPEGPRGDYQGMIIVLDLANENGLNDAKTLLEKIKEEKRSDTEYLVVGAKSDAREISERAARKLASDFGFPYVECSAKENMGIEEMLTIMAQQIICRDEQPKRFKLSGVPGGAGLKTMCKKTLPEEAEKFKDELRKEDYNELKKGEKEKTKGGRKRGLESKVTQRTDILAEAFREKIAKEGIEVEEAAGFIQSHPYMGLEAKTAINLEVDKQRLQDKGESKMPAFARAFITLSNAKIGMDSPLMKKINDEMSGIGSLLKPATHAGKIAGESRNQKKSGWGIG